MIINCPSEYRYFLQENGSVYPYRDILKTRKSMHVSWLIIKRQGRCGTKWCSIPSKMLKKCTVTHLIISKEALPIPSDISEILDVMECWGKGYDLQWHNLAIDYVGYLCSNGFELNRESIVHHVIEIGMRVVVQRRQRRGSNHLPFNMAMEEWEAFFDEQYKYGKSRRFIDLARASFRYMQALI